MAQNRNEWYRVAKLQVMVVNCQTESNEKQHKDVRKRQREERLHVASGEEALECGHPSLVFVAVNWLPW